MRDKVGSISFHIKKITEFRWIFFWKGLQFIELEAMKLQACLTPQALKRKPKYKVIKKIEVQSLSIRKKHLISLESCFWKIEFFLNNDSLV